MPLYEYQCQSCHHRFEVIQKFSDAPIEICPSCGGPVSKLLSSPAIQFKGSGFYITDYARKEGGSSSKSAASSSTESDSKPAAGAESGTGIASSSAASSSTASPSAPAKPASEK